MRYFKAICPTPVLNRSDFSSAFEKKEKDLLQSATILFKDLEMIAFPGTIFTILSTEPNFILKVETEEYPSPYPIFVDSRFGVISEKKELAPIKKLPQASLIIERLNQAVGLPYIWGGNYSKGIPEMMQYYSPSSHSLSVVDPFWTFKGVDCSGLLYEATDGIAPRNTSELLFFGEVVAIAGLKEMEIASLIRPLDLIVWKGHVIVTINSMEVIESNHASGKVIIGNTLSRLNELMKGKAPINDPSLAYEDEEFFVIKRFMHEYSDTPSSLRHL